MFANAMWSVKSEPWLTNTTVSAERNRWDVMVVAYRQVLSGMTRHAYSTNNATTESKNKTFVLKNSGLSIPVKPVMLKTRPTIRMDS